MLKNALDWASRPTADLPLTGKPIAVFVATPSRVLGHRVLADTARILTGFANIVIPGPEVIVHSATTSSPPAPTAPCSRPPHG